jgi:hypothetical protein
MQWRDRCRQLWVIFGGPLSLERDEIDLRYSESYSLKPSSLVPPPNVSARSEFIIAGMAADALGYVLLAFATQCGWPSPGMILLASGGIRDTRVANHVQAGR